MKILNKLKSYLDNKTIMKDTKIYSIGIILAIYFIAFFKVIMNGDLSNFSISGLVEVTLWIVPLSIICSFWYAVHEFNQKNNG